MKYGFGFFLLLVLLLFLWDEGFFTVDHDPQQRGMKIIELATEKLYPGQGGLDDLASYPQLRSFFVSCSADARPTADKDVVVYDPNYREKDGYPWVVIIRVRKHVWKGIGLKKAEDFYIVKQGGRIGKAENAHYLIENTDGLKFYYCYLKETPAKNR